MSAGTSATFRVTAGGSQPLNYQWQKNGVNIDGATAASYTTPAVTAADNGSTFVVVVSNSSGAIKSSAATLIVSSTTLRSYATNFPLTENPISESGNWINGGTVGLSWSNVRTTPSLAFGTESGSGGYDDSTAILAGNWNADQMAQGTVHTANQNAGIFEEIELRLRTSVSAHDITGYEFNFRALASGNTYVQIVRWNGSLGSFSILASTPGPGIRDGDLIKGTAVGNTLTAFVNGVQILQTTDSTFPMGNPGLGFFNQGGGVQIDADYGLKDFFASELAH